MNSPTELWSPTLLFALLRRMDAEATTVSPHSGLPYGLCDYGRHARPDLDRPSAEVEWSRRLAELLAAAGVGVETEVAYPASAAGRRTKCDLVLNLTGTERLWIEVKGAWRSYWGGNSKIYRSYLLHPLVADLDPTKTHTVPFDLHKLSVLRPPEATAVCELLVGFESADDPMDDEIADLVRLAGLNRWRGRSDAWDSPSCPGHRVRVWCWWYHAGGWESPVPVAPAE